MTDQSLGNHLIELESYLPRLKERRSTDTFANDCYEAADYWCGLGRRALASDTRVNYPERVRGEFELLAELQGILRDRPIGDQQEFGALLATGGQLLKIVSEIQPPKDGHLGFLRIVRSNFEFLQKPFAFTVADEQPTSIRFSSGAVYIELEHSISTSSSCTFGPESVDSNYFWIDDLLYLNHDERYRSLPERLEMNTEAEIEDWFGFLAGIFRQYGLAVLANQPNAFAELTKAQSERDAAYVREMELKYGTQGNAPE